VDTNRRLTLAAGLVLILFGALFLIVQLIPGLQIWRDPGYWWPLMVIAWGIGLLMLGLLIHVPALAVPACVTGGVGALLFWQNATNQWESWAYVWTLIPAFVGVGVILMGLLSGKSRQSLGAGLWLILISTALFGVFGSLLGGIHVLGIVWPALLIALGVLLLARAMLSAGKAR
jgi:hypothetical protein